MEPFRYGAVVSLRSVFDSCQFACLQETFVYASSLWSYTALLSLPAIAGAIWPDGIEEVSVPVLSHHVVSGERALLLQLDAYVPRNCRSVAEMVALDDRIITEQEALEMTSEEEIYRYSFADRGNEVLSLI